MTAAAALCLLLCAGAPVPSANLLPGGGFETFRDGRPEGWDGLWTREADSGSLHADRGTFHEGKLSVRVEHGGARDWSLNAAAKLPVSSGDIYRLEGWVKVQGEGSVTLCAITYDTRGRVRSWVQGARTATRIGSWRHLDSRWVVPPGVAAIRPRVIGQGPATVWVDGVRLACGGSVETLRRSDMPETISLQSAALSVTLRTRDGTLEVTDRRTGTTWRQLPQAGEGVLLDARSIGNDRGVEMRWLQVSSGLEVRARLQLDGTLAEIELVLSAEGELPGSVRFPHPFVTRSGTYLVLPMNEGISYPVEDPTIPPMRLIAYGGHGICMGFWGATDGREGYLAIIETPDDASVNVLRLQGKLCIAPQWDPQKGRFGPTRRLRYVFLEKGGHAGICKRYRLHAKKAGLFRTLEEKRLRNPHVDLLLGAVNVWYWGNDALDLVKEMKSLGIERVLWSHRQPPPVIRAMNDLGGILTSRYDIYQDLMDPEVVRKHLRGRHSDWTQDGWPGDLMLDEHGRWRRGWRVRGRDGKMYPCGVLCDARAPAHARKRVPDELKTHPYRCRFIDTTTASPWRECYAPEHPMTRSDSRRSKMELLGFMSEDMGLVTGSETGHEAAVPYVHYFEGMLSLGPYRIPDAGRNMLQVVHDVPERVAKFQVGEKYRLPLWELVYHDCVVAQWYWGDYNNKMPSLWDKRDLFNLLYGTPPMFLFNRRIWRENRDRFVRSYKTICPVVRQVATREMLDHRFLTADRSVQQTRFAGGITITVNFGATPFAMPDGVPVASGGYRVAGIED